MKQTLSWFVSVLYRDFSAHTASALQALGLSRGQLPFLLMVGKHPGCSPTDLTRVLHLDWGHCQRSLDKLVRDGFLLREKQGRSYALTLTARGEEAFALSHQVFDSWDQKVLQRLTDEERQQLSALMEKLSGTIGGTRYV